MLMCSECKAKFSSTIEYKRHLDHRHPSIEEYTCIQGDCREANRYFDKWATLTRHFSHFHKEDLSNVEECETNTQKNASIPTVTKKPRLQEDEPKTTNKIHLHTIISDLLFKFCALLYTKNVSRFMIQVIMVTLQHFLEQIIKHIKEELRKNLESHGVSENIINKSFIVFHDLIRPFENFCTENSRLKQLKQRNLIEPEAFVIGECVMPVSRYNSLQLVPSSLTGQFIPLRKTIKQFFSMKGVLKTVLNYTQEREKNCEVFSNFVHGQYWQKKRFNEFFRDKKVIPFNIYFDEFEVNNPLGSHKNIQTVSAVYCFFPTLPEEFRSRLENIFLVLLFNSKDQKDNDRAFQVLVDEINFLQDEGLEFEIDQKKEKVYFALGLLTGDNKGVNEILGFSSFSSKFYCRFCKSDASNNQKDCELRETLLRKREEYEEDVALGAEKTGVKENSIWNKIKFFHVYWNFFVDTMHDLSEGVFKYDMGHILFYMIVVKQWFTVEHLNERMDCFNYNFFSIRNRPPPITLNNVEKKKIVMSASETTTFVRLFAFFVSDFVDKTDDVWKFYLTIRELFDLINSSHFQPELVSTLPLLVKRHHTFYRNLFKDSLKPKFHHLLHYAMCILMSGPLRWLSALRGEAKHQSMKNIAKSTTSRKNILYTIAIREQIKVCFRFNSGEAGLNDNQDLGPCTLFDVNNHDSQLTSVIPKSILDGSVETEWISINGTIYKEGSFILIDVPYGDQPIFGVIKILIVKNECFHIIYRKVETDGFDKNIFAYKAKKTDQYLYLSDIKKNLYRPGTLVAKELSDGKTYILANKIL